MPTMLSKSCTQSTQVETELLQIMEEKASRKIVRTQEALHMQEEADFVPRRFRSKKNAVRGGLRKMLTTDSSQHKRSHCSGNFSEPATEKMQAAFPTDGVLRFSQKRGVLLTTGKHHEDFSKESRKEICDEVNESEKMIARADCMETRVGIMSSWGSDLIPRKKLMRTTREE